MNRFAGGIFGERWRRFVEHSKLREARQRFDFDWISRAKNAIFPYLAGI
jgi:hypothetical protein